jgi:toxin YoeB
MLQINFKSDAWFEYIYWQTQDRKTLKKINQLIIDIARNPFEGIGKPEPLKGDLSGFWSRRIDDQNRILYVVGEFSITISSCKSHYE